MESRPPSSQVIEAVARKEGVSETELSPPLYDVLDGDALDALFESSAERGSYTHLEFEYDGHVVHVEDDETTGITVHLGGTPSVDPDHTADPKVEPSE